MDHPIRRRLSAASTAATSSPSNTVPRAASRWRDKGREDWKKSWKGEIMDSGPSRESINEQDKENRVMANHRSRQGQKSSYKDRHLDYSNKNYSDVKRVSKLRNASPRDPHDVPIIRGSLLRGWGGEEEPCRRKRWRSPSTSSSTKSVDSEEDYRRSRSRERQRRRRQYETMQRSRRSSTCASQVFWDGFQWVKKTEGDLQYDQEMNSTRKARRLHIGNLPCCRVGASEEAFRAHLWAALLANHLHPDNLPCPIQHIWFARDRGGSFGFVEMTSVEAAHAALRLDGLAWMGASVRINRPTNWKADDVLVDELANVSGLTLAAAERLTAAALQARSTGNDAGLTKLVSDLPESGQDVIKQVLDNAAAAQPNPAERALQLLKEKIKADILQGIPSRVVRFEGTVEGNQPLKLNELESECAKFGALVRTLVIDTAELLEKIPATMCCVGDVLVEFAKGGDADDCIIGLCGVILGGSPIRVDRFDEQLWETSLKNRARTVFMNYVQLGNKEA